MSKHSKHVSTLGCSTNFGDITLTKICVLRILHQDRHTGANLIVQVCFCNTTVQTNDITSARWLHCHHRYSDFSLCKSIVTLFFMSVVLLFKHKQGSISQPDGLSSLLSCLKCLSFLISRSFHLSSILSIWSQSVQGKEKKIHSTQAEKHQIRGYDGQGSVARLVFTVSWVFPSLLSAQEGFYRPGEILQSSFSSTHVKFRW